jgi:hypothetical protein
VSLLLSSIVHGGVLTCCLAAYAAIEWTEYGFSLCEEGVPSIEHPKNQVFAGIGHRVDMK